MTEPTTRSAQLERSLTRLLGQAPEIEAAAIVSFDGLPMASALPAGMDEDRVAAMSAALLSLGERAAQGLGRGELNQVYIEGEHGTVFLVSAADEAVVVAVAARAAKVGMMLFEVRRAAAEVASALSAPEPAPIPAPWPVAAQTPVPAPQAAAPAPPASPEPAPPMFLSSLLQPMTTAPNPLEDPLQTLGISTEPPAWP
jgi:predicted regulator of Ras-like GTPase activity (Roadblock/LC7/MglB family)